ncbi:putative jacalin-like lectin domain-containing protein [Helianthus annuus]|nr:putative jacalin-like lectin domain-containing protein [Helianthus annuus]
MVALYKHPLVCTIIITSFFAFYLSSNSLDSLNMDTGIQLGANVGSYWDDGVHGGVRQITLVYGSCIDSMCVTYDKDGRSFPAVKHGGMGGTKSAQIKLQFPEEILIGVSGHFYHVVHGGFPVVRSLTLTSNRRTFGPFGVEEGTPFNFFTNRGHIVGFYGRSGWFLDSIGFYLSNHKPNLFRRIPVMFEGSNLRAAEDEEHQKAKGSKGYSWGI